MKPIHSYLWRDVRAKHQKQSGVSVPCLRTPQQCSGGELASIQLPVNNPYTDWSDRVVNRQLSGHQADWATASPRVWRTGCVLGFSDKSRTSSSPPNMFTTNPGPQTVDSKPLGDATVISSGYPHYLDLKKRFNFGKQIWANLKSENVIRSSWRRV